MNPLKLLFWLCLIFGTIALLSGCDTVEVDGNKITYDKTSTVTSINGNCIMTAEGDVYMNPYPEVELGDTVWCYTGDDPDSVVAYRKSNGGEIQEE